MRTLLTLLVLAIIAPPGQAHYHMLIPDKPSAKKGEEVTVTCQFGHPFESELSDMLAPREVWLAGPDNRAMNVTKKLEKVSLKGPKGKVDGYRLKFAPDKRGDYTIVMLSAPTYLAADKQTIQDTVKVVVHVQAQKGWDGGFITNFDLLPMTRPYGLLPNAVFQARVVGRGGSDKDPRPSEYPPVEVERYNPTPPKELPADEFITRTMKVSNNGVVTTNLPEAGWWCLTATYPHLVKAKVDGKEIEVTRRATFWVHVDKTAPIKPPASEP